MINTGVEEGTLMTPIVTCTLHGKCLPVLEASVRTYCPDVKFFAFKSEERTTANQAFSAALDEIFKVYDEVIICGDDVVLNPKSYSYLMEDVNDLKLIHGDKLGFVCAHSDSIRNSQNIRFKQSEEDYLYKGKWSWEHKYRKIDFLSPIFSWYSKKAYMDAPLMPLDWFGDDVVCLDLINLGYTHYISKSYVHHVGSQTVGSDTGKMYIEAINWLENNRPDIIHRFKR